MENDQSPSQTEQAELPREQVGPFFLLGLDKDATDAEIEAHWAQRIIWARKEQIAIHLGNINWAREVIMDPERRVRADVASFNPDLSSRELGKLAERYSLSSSDKPAWPVLDVEKPLADYVPPTVMPDPEEVRAAIKLPEMSLEIMPVISLLRGYVQEPLDPWDLHLPL
jgi:hypothetical protein